MQYHVISRPAAGGAVVRDIIEAESMPSQVGAHDPIIIDVHVALPG